MKSIIMAAALYICSFTLLAQLNLSKEIQVQQINSVKSIAINCKSVFLLPKAEYKSFVEYMKRPPVSGVVNGLNFHIKYTMVTVPDSAIHTPNSDVNQSLTADFLAYNLSCNSIVADNIPFSSLFYNTENYNVSLATNLGILSFTNIATGIAKRFTLSPLGYGIYSGSVSSSVNGIAVKETVVVVLNRWNFNIGG